MAATTILLAFAFWQNIPGLEKTFFWALVFITLLTPEALRAWRRDGLQVPLTFILCDVVFIVLSTVVVNHHLLLLFIPLIIASTPLAARHVPLILAAVALGLQYTLFLSAARFWLPLDLVLLYSLILILTGAVTMLLGHHLDRERAIKLQLEKKLEARSDYFLMRAHEIRTPLTLIRASVELILDGAPGPLTEQQRIFLENVDENSQHMGLLAENMLTKSKLESEVFAPTFQAVDVRDPIRAVIADMRTFAIRREQDIRVHYPQILPLINADSVLLRQVLTNLIRNAIQHTSSGGQIIVSIVKNDLNLLISVTDDGAGMSPEQRKQVFQRFATGRGGTGLGLMIVKQIVELHNGKVYIDTSLGQGTTFMLTFPFLPHATDLPHATKHMTKYTAKYTAKKEP